MCDHKTSQLLGGTTQVKQTEQFLSSCTTLSQDGQTLLDLAAAICFEPDRSVPTLSTRPCPIQALFSGHLLSLHTNQCNWQALYQTNTLGMLYGCVVRDRLVLAGEHVPTGAVVECLGQEGESLCITV